LFSSGDSFTLLWLNAAVYKAILVGFKPKIFSTCLSKEVFYRVEQLPNETQNEVCFCKSKITYLEAIKLIEIVL
jgi:hypothetical protein